MPTAEMRPDAAVRTAARSRPIRVLELRSVRGAGGGPEKTILHGAAQADSSRCRVTVCYIRDQRDRAFELGERARTLGVDYVELHERHSADPSVWGQLRRLVSERAIDIVHAHEYKTDLLAYLLWRRKGLRALATAHGWTGNSPRERYLYYPVDRWILARMPRVIAVSTDIGDAVVRAGAPRERVTVLLNGIDPAHFIRRPEKRDAIRAALGFGPSDILIGAVGRVERQKRFDLLVEAAAPILESRPAVHILIVGDGGLMSEIAGLVERRGLQTRVHLLGHRTDIIELHHAFDGFVQSSDYEGTPNAVLEAMAMETPLVATDAGGTRELAADEEHGLIVPIGDVPQLSRAMLRLLDDPDGARARAAAARRRIETDLSFLGRTRKLEAIYAEMVDA